MVLIAISLAALPAAAEGEPATQPERDWGEATKGLQVSLAFDGVLAVGGEFRVDARLRNAGQVAVALPDNAAGEGEPFGWLFVVQQVGGEKKAFYTDKLPLARGLEDWPDELPGGVGLRLVADTVSARIARPYRPGLKVVDGYPVAPTPGKPRPDVQHKRLRDALTPGPALCRLMLYLPRPDAGDLMLTSNTVRLSVAPPDFTRLDPREREAFVAELLAQFDRSAWGGKAAHATAVGIGKPVLPDLIKAVEDRSRTRHSRMWLATAVAGIRDERAAAALERLLADSLPGVRHVVAYHGPKQRSAALDAAILRRARESAGPRFAAYALLGSMVHRADAPAELLAVALDSNDPKVQAAVRSALRHYASDTVVARLSRLAAGEDAHLAGAARKVLAAMGYTPHTRPASGTGGESRP